MINYTGYLLAAHPRRPQDFFSQGVILIFKHDATGAIGLQINRAFTTGASMTSVMENLGITANFDDDPLHMGGEHGGNRVYVVHSLDWYTANSLQIGPNLGVSGDISVITAISENQGPSQFRAIAGYNIWGPGELESELDGTGVDEITQEWSYVPATVDLIFDYNGVEQWRRVIDAAGQQQTARWLS